MAMNIVEYIDSYQYTFEEKPFNDVDSLILCQLSYFKMTGLIPTPEENAAYVSLQEYLTPEHDEQIFVDTRYADNNRLMAAALLRSRRFQNVRMNYLKELLDKTIEIQFTALTFQLTDNLYYIAYRGTDETLIGWKEDFTLAYSEPVLGQLCAEKYIKRILDKLDGEFYVGGHSKGGNLAVFAAMLCPAKLQPYIKRVYSHDGPGFKKEVLERYNYKNIEDRVIKILPKQSLVGMMLEQEVSDYIVECSSFGIFQHDPFNWLVEEDHFIKTERLDMGSLMMDRAINEWVLTLSEDQIRSFTEEFFDLAMSTEYDNLVDMLANVRKTASGLIHAAKELDPKTRKEMENTMKGLVDYFQKMAGNEIHAKTLEGINEVHQKTLEGMQDVHNKTRAGIAEMQERIQDVLKKVKK